VVAEVDDQLAVIRGSELAQSVEHRREGPLVGDGRELLGRTFRVERQCWACARKSTKSPLMTSAIRPAARCRKSPISQASSAVEPKI
jgi:hypothetical protein